MFVGFSSSRLRSFQEGTAVGDRVQCRRMCWREGFERVGIGGQAELDKD